MWHGLTRIWQVSESHLMLSLFIKGTQTVQNRTRHTSRTVQALAGQSQPTMECCMSHSAPSVSFWLTKGPGRRPTAHQLQDRKSAKQDTEPATGIWNTWRLLHCTAVWVNLCVWVRSLLPLRVSSFNAIQQCVYICQNVAQTESRTHAWLVDIPQSTHPNSQMWNS